MYKAAIALILITLFGFTNAYGDEVDAGLGNMASDQVRASARLLIKNGAGSEQVIDMTRLMLQHRFTAENVIRAHQVVVAALKQGLPPEPIMNKAGEGVAKQVQAAGIIKAMEQVQTRYAAAYHQARTLSTDQPQVRALGNTMANCLAAGLTEPDMLAIMAGLKVRLRTMDRAEGMDLSRESFNAARDMTRVGLDSARTGSLVSLALQNRYSAREMAVMRNSFMAQAKASSPDQAARQFTQAIQNGAPADSLGAAGGGSSTAGSSTGSGGSSASGESSSGDAGNSGDTGATNSGDSVSTGPGAGEPTGPTGPGPGPGGN